MNIKGVTLIELLIVIVVMGIIAAFSVVSVSKIIKNTKTSAMVNEIYIIEGAVGYYTFDVGERPYGSVSGAGTCATWNADSRKIFIEGTRSGIPIPNWSGPYVNTWADETPLGGCYVYRSYLVGAQSWARSNWLRYSDDATMGSIAPADKDIELIMIRFYPLTSQSAIDEAMEALEYLSGKFDSEQLFYVNGQAVIGYYILPN